MIISREDRSPAIRQKSGCLLFNIRIIRQACYPVFYSFTLPAEILPMIYFEQKQNTIRIGTMETARAI